MIRAMAGMPTAAISEYCSRPVLAVAGLATSRVRTAKGEKIALFINRRLLANS
jgi:hypothetical protein